MEAKELTEIEFHPLLKRQLKRVGFDLNAVPQDIKAWTRFLFHVNNAYFENDQDRYTLERSLEISSKEMQELFEQLERSQDVSKIGSWAADLKVNKVTWSTKTYEILQYSPQEITPSLELFLNRIYSDDKHIMLQAIQDTEKNGTDFKIELRLEIDGKLTWLEVYGHPFLDPIEKKVIKVAGVNIDITERKKSDEHLKKLHEELVTAARRAGMSDIAVNILHNVGNILNSVNVTAELLRNRLAQSKLANLAKALGLLKQTIFESEKDSGSIEKTKQIIEYLDQLCLYWEKEKDHFLKEMDTLDTHILQIKNVVNMQQAISGVIGHVEPVYLHEALNDALNIELERIQKHNIRVVKEFSPLNAISLDKIKLLQILMNLISNATDALSQTKNVERTLIVKTELQDPDVCYIEVSDNGIGIKKDDLNRVFSYGFTTKKEGHGFGLHSSVLLAKELGGRLSVFSKGPDAGATFTLKLPTRSMEIKGVAE